MNNSVIQFVAGVEKTRSFLKKKLLVFLVLMYEDQAQNIVKQKFMKNIS